MNPREQFEGRKIPAFGKGGKECLQPGIKSGLGKPQEKAQKAKKDRERHQVKSGTGLTPPVWSCKREVRKYGR